VEVPVLVTCWSTKGGSGTTVVAASLALLLARRSPHGAVLADLAGDGPAVLGVAEPDSPGLAGWLAAGDAVPVDGLTRLEVALDGGLALLPRGAGALAPPRAGVLARVLARGSRPVVADCGTDLGGAALALVEAADRSLLVTRACYLALRRARQVAVRPSGVVLVREPGRALGRDDVEVATQAPVAAEVELDPGVARAVDAGLLGRSLPRTLERRLSHVL
jgi:MinD-like ATPase involved in chromosome partitioning or flagellar assembly